MSAKRKATAIMQHHKENISTPEPADISEDDHYSSVIMKDADKLKLMLLAWNYSLQQQAQVAGGGPAGAVPVPGQPGQLPPTAQQPAQLPVTTAQNGPALSPSSTTAASSSNGTLAPVVTSQSVISTANSTVNNNSTLTGTRSVIAAWMCGRDGPRRFLHSSVLVNQTEPSAPDSLSLVTDSRNGSADMSELSATGGVPVSGVVPTTASSEDMASLWASYTMGLKKTPPPGSSTPSRSERDRDRESSPGGGEGAGSAHDETSSSGNKEDEDDDDEDADERLDPRHHDPERLKAFNMFVRLFVDENLDRIVPISKQPKEKIQAIIDSCTRQFPEFAERARKRIRTYLKSCRRNKRGREGAPWDAARPTPAHLTSVQAEQILATACENESDNAKRMRVGLEPVSQPMPTLPAATQTDVRASLDHFTSSTPVKSLPIKREDTPPTALTSLAPLTSLANLPNSAGSLSSTPLSLAPASKLLNNSDSAKTLMSQATIVSSSTANGIGSGGAGAAAGAPTAMYRPNFSQAFQRAGPTPVLSAGLYPTQSFTSGLLSNGPTDLSMKNTKPLLSHKLNATEMTAVRQLINGYRESAAFLLRSADELEQLLLQQP
ncbi:nucleolar protein 4-like isoform X2 [Nasonia vitripennis]|uniref:Nucleolar protein 4 helical domain-containing protein n=1 Tax=Nasonia vitripennis TaxID=7425 RepID=A0A7M7PXI5_NASVI|nr:nucleolar protein 4-like isoform X2 [Nasonia vitripennis]